MLRTLPPHMQIPQPLFCFGRRSLSCLGIVVALWVSGLSLTPLSAQQAEVQAPRAAAVAPTEPRFHLIRSVCGSKGSQRGDQYVIEDPRSVFYLPEDKQVIIYFEWEGPLGQHHLNGIWKNTEGKAVVLSDFDYEAKQKRFAGYWTLPLTDEMTPGMWALEAHVDGELAGTYNFQVTLAPRPALPLSKPVLTPGEIYKLLLPATVSVERLDSPHRRTSVGSGFIIGSNLVVTTFENIESASSVRVTLSNGISTDLYGLLAWNHREDWAVLPLPAQTDKALTLAKPGSWQVGDSCYSLDSAQRGNRTIVSGHITGSHTFPDVGARLNLSFRLSPSAEGSPVVSEYGEVIGIASAASLVPGLSSLSLSNQGSFPQYPGNLAGEGLTPGFGAELAIPMELVKSPKTQLATPLTTFADLAKSGQFPERLSKNEDVMLGTLGRAIERVGAQLQVKDERFEFQRRDGQLSVLITWHGEKKLKSIALFKIYNIDNRLVGTSKPAKVNVAKGQLLYSSWDIQIGQLCPGFYRIDLVLESTPVWRSFFRLTD